jgi:PAS domain S-box-containing protein
VQDVQPPRILVVDDERHNRQLLEVMLGPEGFRIDVAGSGEEALAIIARQPPDLILLDIMMSGIGGYELTVTLKGNVATKNIPIIMVTALDDRKARMLGLSAGAEDFLSHPVDRAELVVRVRNLLRLKAYGDFHDKYSQVLEAEVGSRTADLVASEARYRRIVETTNQGIWMLDAQGRTEFMNGRMATMLGYESNEVLGLPFLDFVDEDWHALSREEIEQGRAGPRQAEGRLKRKDGTRFWVLVESAPRTSESGAYEGSFAMVMDVSERKLQEDALRVSQGRLRELWDSGLILITISDSAGNIHDINEAGAAMLGYSRDELLSGAVHWSEITPPEWVAGEEAARAQLLATGVASPWEKELICKDGSRIAILAGAALTNGSEGIAIAIDITEKKRAQTDLLERVQIAALTAEVALALAQADDLPEILRRCVDAMHTHLDGALARIWLMKDGLLDLHASAGLQSEADLVAGSAPLPKFDIGLLAEERRPYFTNDALHDRRMTDRAWVKREEIVGFAALPLLVAGRVVGVITLFARHSLSEAVLTGLGALSDAIAVGVQRKLAEDARVALEHQLRQAQKMEAIGQLAGGIAHDFNNLLSVILSYSELLAGELKEGDPMRADVDEIRGAGVRAVDLTRQLLAFSRQQVLQPKIVDVSVIVAGMEKMLRRLLGEDVELVSLAGPSLGKIRVDPGQMEQVIMNLAVNARDAMPRGGKLTVETAEVVLDDAYAAKHVGVKPGLHAMLSVSDTGTGMDKATQARMFEPFFTTKGLGKGTGLGLATVFGIVRQSDGTIWVESELGKGTTFSAYFPMADGAAIASAPKPAPEGGTLHGSETILLVEDEERVRVLARSILRKYGYTVLDAQSPGDAFLLCEQHDTAIDLLLTDVVMPRMSGRELAERLLQIRPAMRVLYMSGYTDDAIMRHGILESSLAFLQKPITPEALVRKVREVMDARAPDRRGLSLAESVEGGEELGAREGLR